jgi:hypothetical protein
LSAQAVQAPSKCQNLRISDHRIALADGDTLGFYDFRNNSRGTLFKMAGGLIQNLGYDPKTDRCLFSMSKVSNNRRRFYTYSFGPVNELNPILTQMAQDISTNAQWVLNGDNVAFVGINTTTNELKIDYSKNNYLAIRTKDLLLNTNLFERGSIQNYSVSPNGENLYLDAKEHLGIQHSQKTIARSAAKG